MGRYRLLAGTHMEDNKKLYKKGSVVESDNDLETMFGPEKFATLPELPAAPAPKAEAAEETAEKGESSVVTTKYVDVSEAFPGAAAVDMLVFRKGAKQYFVSESDNPTVYLNSKALKESEVAAFIEAKS